MEEIENRESRKQVANRSKGGWAAKRNKKLNGGLNQIVNLVKSDLNQDLSYDGVNL